MKERVYKIAEKDVTSLAKNKDGSFRVPDGYEIYKVPTREERIAERIAKLEAELKEIKKPTEAELIQEGKMMHPYFMYRDELEYLNKELK